MVGAAWWLRARAGGSTAELLGRMPVQDAVLLHIDLAALRRAGLLDTLAGAQVAAEPEYRAFLEETGFDYTRDLDLVLVSFHQGQTFFLLGGRFRWDRIRAYSTRHGGSCAQGYCTMTGSRPDRRISMFPMRSGLMAMAVGPDARAVERLRGRGRSRLAPPAAPSRPIWISMSASLLERSDALPAGARAFVSAFQGAERVTLSMGARDRGLEAVLEVHCRTPEDAAATSARLAAITERLRRFISREKQAPNPRDLSGVLTAGSFRSVERRVHGTWPIEKAFLAAIAGGSL